MATSLPGHIEKVIWIANKHLHNYNLQNNPHYQVITIMMMINGLVYFDLVYLANMMILDVVEIWFDSEEIDETTFLPKEVSIIQANCSVDDSFQAENNIDPGAHH